MTLLTLAGCGSKISEANYYRVQHGMSEGAVETLLGPAHEETSDPPATAMTTAATTAPVSSSQPAPRKLKVWKRGGLTIRVTFADGKVVSRSAEGMVAESARADRIVHAGARATVSLFHCLIRRTGHRFFQ